MAPIVNLPVSPWPAAGPSARGQARHPPALAPAGIDGQEMFCRLSCPSVWIADVGFVSERSRVRGFALRRGGVKPASRGGRGAARAGIPGGADECAALRVEPVWRGRAGIGPAAVARRTREAA